MTLAAYISDLCARDPEFAHEYNSPDRELFMAGVFLHAQRIEQKISLQKLSQKSRVPAARLRAFENGDPAISYDEFCSLLDALGDSPKPLSDLRSSGRSLFPQTLPA